MGSIQQLASRWIHDVGKITEKAPAYCSEKYRLPVEVRDFHGHIPGQKPALGRIAVRAAYCLKRV